MCLFVCVCVLVVPRCNLLNPFSYILLNPFSSSQRMPSLRREKMRKTNLGRSTAGPLKKVDNKRQLRITVTTLF